MMTIRSRFFSSSSGSASIPSRSGISMSRSTTSGLCRSTCSTASRPVRNDATILRSGSASIQRETSPRTTTASSTIITRSASGTGGGAGARVAATLMPGTRLRDATNPTEDRSNQADFLEFGLNDFLVERLHDVFVRARTERPRDVRDIILGGAEHVYKHIAAGETAHRLEKVIAVHHRHVPVEQDRVGQCAAALLQRLLAVFCLRNLEVEPFENTPRHLADDA